MPSHCSATGASPAVQRSLQHGPDVPPVIVRLVQPVRVRRGHLPAQPDLELCPQREQRQHVQPALAVLPGFLLVLLAPDGAPGHRRPRRAGQPWRPLPGAAPAAALGGLPGRVDVIPADHDPGGRVARPYREHGQVGGVPPPRLGDLDAAGLFAAEGDQNEFGLQVGVARQPKLPGLPADGMLALAARHQGLARRKGREPRPVRQSCHDGYLQRSGSVARTSADRPPAWTSTQFAGRVSGGTSRSRIALSPSAW